jgi:hypothetical protein
VKVEALHLFVAVEGLGGRFGASSLRVFALDVLVNLT